MLCVVGDSNASYLSSYLLSPEVDTSMCRPGWTSEQVTSAVRRGAAIAGRATAFVLFTGMNDVASSDGLVHNVSSILALLAQRRSSVAVPIFVVPLFCVSYPDGTPAHSMGKARRQAARDLKLAVRAVPHVHYVAPHLSPRTHDVRPNMTSWVSATKLDPLHLNAFAYRVIATSINDTLNALPSTTLRAVRPTHKARNFPPRRTRTMRRARSRRRRS